MADITKDVLVKVDTKIGSNDGLKKVGDDAKSSSKTIGELRNEAVKASSSFTDLAKRFEQIDKQRAFQKQAADIKKASSSLDEYRHKVQALVDEEKKLADFKMIGEKGGAGAGAGGEGGGKGGLGGFRSTMRGMHMVGRIADIGLSEGAVIAQNMSGVRGGGALEKGEGGILLNKVAELHDAFTGRAIKDKIADQSIQRESIQSERRAAFAAAEAHASDLRQQMLSPTSVARSFNPFAKVSESSRLLGEGVNLDLQSGALAKRIGGRNAVGDLTGTEAKIGAQDAIRRNARNTIINAQNAGADGLGDIQRDNLTKMIKATTELGLLMKQQTEDLQKQVQIDTQRLTLVKQIADARKQDVKEKRIQFAEMNPLQQQRAIDLGKRLNGGEKLEGAEMEEAQGYGVLQDLVQKQKLSDPEMNKQFAQLMANIGDDAQQKAAQKVIAEGGGNIEVNIQLDEEKLAKELEQHVGDVIKRLETATKKAATVAAQAKEAQEAKAAQQRALLD